ncbi:hypothetical protein K488DRAFT_49250 [Vararia minispora EC-137]|uniref:Uncharacterized protein n=1 Tax=Vararia minispora EC-137 TaxID=1314806 RepID=A0ACB8QM70_9AGAM|nr:hypothetical protein K488DRAFT_49250 [Vararia minispora EC-137]
MVAGSAAFALFICVLFAFVAESELTRYVQTTLGYRQPFFLFYVVHSSFFFIFPVHLGLLSSHQSPRNLLKGVIYAVKIHNAPLGQKTSVTLCSPFPAYKFCRLAFLCTIGTTVPALLWFAAVTLAPLSDVTAIWNTNAFFAYIITVYLYSLPWDKHKLIAVALATVGVMAVVYGGSQLSGGEASKTSMSSAPLLGDLMTLVASVGYGLYQVLYKRHAALPTDPEPLIADELYERLSISSEDSLHELPDAEVTPFADAVYPPPFGFHPNFITSAIGLFTFALLIVFLPVLNYMGWEKFMLPPDWWTVFSIIGIAVSGVVFNSGLMVLLNVWGPIVVSVGNLLTIVLVFVADVLFGQGPSVITFWSVAGSGSIILAFGILVFDMLRATRAI